MPNDTAPDSVLGVPLNRIVAFLGPHVSWVSGAVATWLLAHAHFLALFHVQHDGLSTFVGQLVIFVAVTAVTWLGHSKWLTGHHIAMQVAASTLAANPPAKRAVAPNPPGQHV